MQIAEVQGNYGLVQKIEVKSDSDFLNSDSQTVETPIYKVMFESDVFDYAKDDLIILVPTDYSEITIAGQNYLAITSSDVLATIKD